MIDQRLLIPFLCVHEEGKHDSKNASIAKSSEISDLSETLLDGYGDVQDTTETDDAAVVVGLGFISGESNQDAHDDQVERHEHADVL